MIEIPLNKALVAVEVEHNTCADCFISNGPYHGCGLKWMLKCSAEKREDSKIVVFKLVDYPPDPSLKVMTEIINKFSDPPLTTEEVDALLKKIEIGEGGKSYLNIPEKCCFGCSLIETCTLSCKVGLENCTDKVVCKSECYGDGFLKKTEINQ